MKLVDLIKAGKMENLTENTQDDLAQWWATVDFGPLDSALSKALGINVKLKYDYAPSRRDNDYTLKITGWPANFALKTGIFRSVIKHVQPYAFNSSISFEQEDQRWAIWAVINLQYTFHNGGSNGSEILTTVFNNDGNGTWKFRLAGK